MRSRTVVLVVAKAPVPGLAKTRLTPPASADQAAEIAAASLLDTLDAIRTMGAKPVVAWTGEIAAARQAGEIAAALAGTTVLAQRGAAFGDRLAAAHADAGRAFPGSPVLQIGMDTPQVTPDLLAASAEPLHRVAGPDAVVGPASDGGWWALGLREPRFAEALRNVPMSRPDTGDRTLRALRASGLGVDPLAELSDVDTMVDAQLVAKSVPGSRFATAVEQVAIEIGDRP
ncbi:DUF2064 domain-containing protein [Saccharopolyspora aridisoli]|uniref:DUF2064 domain-containing protein n=1 Tax=Saccharopolyspora aridisoli TaxID=2530385 RepID=A0A4V2Y8D5_9PSEU|nr:DUF2064 domain-containing protein [Saccharopolyspora aridisoli]TDC95515.1 DUF2064 domain-containing protein [Saccharopolyspora aridisoli]